LPRATLRQGELLPERTPWRSWSGYTHDTYTHDTGFLASYAGLATLQPCMAG
jgi:hypothetical protein